MSFLQSNISVSVQHIPQFEQSIDGECRGKYLCFYLFTLVHQAEFFIKFALSISAQATFLSGTSVTFCLPVREYSIRLLFFPTPLWSFVSWTLIITAPSFRCRLTFLPMNDLALLALKLSIFTIPLLGQRFCSSTVDILVSFRLLFGCRALYFRCGRYLSKDFCNVPLFFLNSSFWCFCF